MKSVADRQPLVSVCVPTYNGAEFLRQCLASLQAQTFADFEVLIVDDDSSDDTLAIAEEFARVDPRFRIHKNPQRLGLVGNWNNCIKLARGEWIKFLFQDDWLENHCLERLLAACVQHGCAFGFCHRDVVFDSSVSAEMRNFFQYHQTYLDEVYGDKDGFLNAEAFTRVAAAKFDHNPIGEPTVVLIQRRAFEEFGGFLPAMVQNCDTEFWMRLGSNTGVAHVAERLATFRVHGRSTTSKNVARRDYRAWYMDPLIQRYVVMNDDRYARLRAELNCSTTSLINWRRLVWSANHARQLAFAAGSTGELKKDWNDVAAIYPDLEQLARVGKILESGCNGASLLRKFRFLKKSSRSSTNQAL